MTTSASGYDITPLSAEERERLAQKLSAEERRILLDHGTEHPFCGGLLDNHEDGTYVCKLCALPLFRSDSKFESGSGWPSFFAPFDPEHVRELRDISHGMVRAEIRCARCDGHLGHVFPDGPKPTGLRFCLNSASMDFVTGDAAG
ncbi:MAG: peptide-methionine (R)-S-oxide reductase MsrB [Dokdonella sp.]